MNLLDRSLITSSRLSVPSPRLLIVTITVTTGEYTGALLSWLAHLTRAVRLLSSRCHFLLLYPAHHPYPGERLW
jgi:hypothetical protein